MKIGRLLQYASEVASDVEIECITAVPIHPLPFDTIAKLLRIGYQIDWNVLLAGPDKNYDLKMLIEASQIKLLNILKVDKQ